MRVRVRAEDGGQRPDPRWTVLFHTEMDSWMPERLPERFRQRGRKQRSRRRNGGYAPRQGAWRPLALTVAVLVVGLLSLSLLPGPSSIPIVRNVHDLIVTEILGGSPAPTPAARPQVTLPPAARPPAGVAPPGQPTASPSPLADQTSPPPQGNAGSSPTSSPGGLLGLPPLPSLPPLLPTPTPPQPAPTPTPKKCILGIICL